MAEFPADSRIAEIEARQDEVMQQIDELNGRIEQTIQLFSPQQLGLGPTNVADVSLN